MSQNYTENFNNLFNATDTWDMLSSIFNVYEINCNGDIFWMVIILIPFMMSLIKQQSVIMPASIGLIVGITLFAMMPPFSNSAVLMLLMISITGIIYHIIKSR